MAKLAYKDAAVRLAKLRQRLRGGNANGAILVGQSFHERGDRLCVSAFR